MSRADVASGSSLCEWPIETRSCFCRRGLVRYRQSFSWPLSAAQWSMVKPSCRPSSSSRRKKITTGFVFALFGLWGALGGPWERQRTTQDEKAVPGKVAGPLGADVAKQSRRRMSGLFGPRSERAAGARSEFWEEDEGEGGGIAKREEEEEEEEDEGGRREEEICRHAAAPLLPPLRPQPWPS